MIWLSRYILKVGISMFLYKLLCLLTSMMADSLLLTWLPTNYCITRKTSNYTIINKTLSTKICSWDMFSWPRKSWPTMARENYDNLSIYLWIRCSSLVLHIMLLYSVFFLGEFRFSTPILWKGTYSYIVRTPSYSLGSYALWNNKDVII